LPQRREAARNLKAKPGGRVNDGENPWVNDGENPHDEIANSKKIECNSKP
jgi:hypothetical protein